MYMYIGPFLYLMYIFTSMSRPHTTSLRPHTLEA